MRHHSNNPDTDTAVPPSSIRVAAIQALAYTGDQEYRNLEQLVAYAEQAAAGGADLVVFPEAYPGPATGPMDWGRRLEGTLDEFLSALAARLGVHLTAGGLESCAIDGEQTADAYYVTHKLYFPDRPTPFTYRRVQPDNPDLNAFFFAGRRTVVPGGEIPVVDTACGRIGLQVCGELWVPEITRIQMLGGADLILAPVNGRATATRLRGMWQTWQHITRARAAENLLYVVVAQKFLVDGPGGGIALIAGPETTLARATSPGVLFADLDLERLRWLRGRVVDNELLQPPKPGAATSSEGLSSATRCGQSLDRRPELYAALSKPQAGAYDFFYYRRQQRS